MDRSRLHVLVVDDDEDHRRLLARCLTDAQMKVTMAGSGPEALEQLQGVDLVLLDYRLPGMSGLDTLAAIREADGPSVIMVTGMGSERLVVEAIQAGAIDYLVKEPHYLATVPDRVRRAWRHHDLARRTAELQRLAFVVTSAVDANEIFVEIVRGARRLLAADACVLLVMEHDGVRVAAHEEIDPASGQDLARSATQLLISSASGMQQVATTDGVLMVPLPSGSGDSMGVLALLDESGQPLPPEDVSLAESFASFAGLALQNLRRFDTERGMTQELAARASQQAAVARLGQMALSGEGVQALLQMAADVVQEVLEVDFVSILQLLPDDETLLLRAGAGWVHGPGQRLVLASANWSEAHATLASGEPVVVDNRSESREALSSPALHAQGVVSEVTVAIPGHSHPYGVLAVDSKSARRFSAQDVDFLQSVANVLAGAIGASHASSDLAHQALHDPLTGLPNRALLLDRLAQALARSRREAATVAVLFLDIDHFKVVNDSLGHSVGDELLMAVADRLRNAVRPADTVGRFGGDEFVVVSDASAGEHEAVDLADRLAVAVARPLEIGGRQVSVTFSIGIVLAHADDDPESLLRDADAAMYRAKDRGRSRHELFDLSMRHRVLERLEMEAELRKAVEAGQLRLVFQPEVSLQTGAITGLEALVRWQHPRRGLLAPSEFMSLAEDAGLVGTVGRWVIKEACRQMRNDPRTTDMTLWVNLSARELAELDLADSVSSALLESGMAPEQLGIEITEAVVMDDVAAVTRALGELRGLGVQLAIDDFGTGFSSLTYLRRFPVSVLKIDQSFVAGLLEGSEDAAIVGAVVGLGHALGLTVVAEGIENVQQEAALAKLGCDTGQGYYLGQPTKLADLDLQPVRLGAAHIPPLALPR